MRVALCQVQSSETASANLDLVRAQARLAAERGAQLAVFPEATMVRFGVPLAPVAESLDGPWASGVQAAAAECDLTVVAGMFTPADGGRVHNTLVVASADGVLGYDKIHLYDAFGFRESDTVAPGSTALVVEVAGTRVGVATCYDVRFPELFVELARRGAAAIALPASWGSGPGKCEQWELLVRARALDSVSWLLAAGQAYPPASGLRRGDGPFGIGHSMVVAPDGTVLARLGDAPEQLIADIEPDTAVQLRRTIPVLDNRVLVR
jgi:deaminated glutathione amidase